MKELLDELIIQYNEIEPYCNKKIYCKKRFNFCKDIFFEKGKYYILCKVILSDTHIRIWIKNNNESRYNCSINLNDLHEYFELKTLADKRNEKINKLMYG